MTTKCVIIFKNKSSSSFQGSLKLVRSPPDNWCHPKKSKQIHFHTPAKVKPKSKWQSFPRSSSRVWILYLTKCLKNPNTPPPLYPPHKVRMCPKAFSQAPLPRKTQKRSSKTILRKQSTRRKKKFVATKLGVGSPEHNYNLPTQNSFCRQGRPKLYPCRCRASNCCRIVNEICWKKHYHDYRVPRRKYLYCTVQVFADIEAVTNGWAKNAALAV